MSEDEREWNECRECGNTMLLDEGHEWPEDGPICWSCLDNERSRLYAEIAVKDQAAAKTGLLVLALMEQRDELRAALGTEQAMHLAWRKRAEEAEAERERLIERWPEFVEGMEHPGPGIIDFADGQWWVDGGNSRHGYPTRSAAVRATAGLEPRRRGMRGP